MTLLISLFNLNYTCSDYVFVSLVVISVYKIWMVLISDHKSFETMKIKHSFRNGKLLFIQNERNINWCGLTLLNKYHRPIPWMKLTQLTLYAKLLWVSGSFIVNVARISSTGFSSSTSTIHSPLPHRGGTSFSSATWTSISHDPEKKGISNRE